MKQLLFSTAALFLVNGCSTNNIRSAVDQTAAESFSVTATSARGKTQSEVDEENERILETKLEDVLNFCLPRLSGYEKSSMAQAKNAYWLSLSGLIAGSVIAPALTASNAMANASSIAALSGWAGASNFAGQALKTSGLSGSAIAETRNGIINNVRDAISIASNGDNTFETRRGALMKARAECIIYEIAVPSIPQGK